MSAAAWRDPQPAEALARRLAGTPEAGPEPTLRMITEAVATRYAVTRLDLLSARRAARIVRPRHVAMYLARRHTSRSLPEIGAALGGRDHTTVMYGIGVIERRLGGDAELAQAVADLEQALCVAVSVVVSAEGRFRVLADADPYAAARRLLDGDHCTLSVEEALAMAGVVVAATLPVVEHDTEPDREASPAHRIVVRPVPANDSVASSRSPAIRAVIDAGRALESARYGRGEGAAINRVIDAIKQLSSSLEPSPKGA